MLHALDLTRSFQAAKTPWQAVSKNDNEAIECARHGFAKAAFQDTLAALPIVTYEAGETVIADGSRTGRLLILKNGTVTILKDDKEIAKAAEPGAVFGELSVLLDQPHTAEVRALETSQFHIADATALLSQNPTAVLCVATVLAQRLDVANHALIQLKSQLQTGEPNVVAKRGGRYRLIKPLNFTMSMAMYLATVVIFLDYLRASMWWKKVIGWRLSICILTAITCITMQAARGTTSHFNYSTHFDSTVSLLMDIVDPLNSVFVLVLLIFALQSKYDVLRSYQLGIVFGILLFLAGSVIGGVMVAHGQSVVGVAPECPGLPVVNWSTKGGDFRVAHFLGIHALQILPIAGWLINQMEGLPRRAKLTAVVAVSAGYVLFMGIVFLQAMNGVPRVRM